MTTTNPYPPLSEADQFNFKNITSASYFAELKANLPDNLARRIPSKYPYIWSKSVMILTMGSEIYRKQDYFKHPLKEWDSEDFDNGLKQIVHQLRGITPDFYISIDEPVTCFYLCETFHFEPLWFDTVMNDDNVQVFRFKAFHVIDSDEITLYFKF